MASLNVASEQFEEYERDDERHGCESGGVPRGKPVAAFSGHHGGDRTAASDDDFECCFAEPGKGRGKNTSDWPHSGPEPPPNDECGDAPDNDDGTRRSELGEHVRNTKHD